MSNYKKNLQALLIGFGMVFFIFALVESFFQLNQRFNWLERIQPEREFAADTYDRNGLQFPNLMNLKPYPEALDLNEPSDYSQIFDFPECHGERMDQNPFWMGVANCHARVTLRKMKSKRVVYDLNYNFDAHARRQIPSAQPDSQNFLLFLGCSYTWGEGVAEEQAFTNLVTEKMGRPNAYNLGMGAYAPNYLLRVLEHGKNDLRLNDIHGKSGIAVYTYIDDQLRRALGGLSWVRHSVLANAPYYFLDQGQLVSKGTFASDRSWTTNFYQWLAKSAILSFFGFEIPPHFSTSELELFAAMIGQIKNKVEQEYGVRQFIFSAYPEKSNYINELRPLLEKRGIVVLDFTGFPLEKLSQGRSLIFGDGHPSPLGHEVYSQLMLHEFQKNKIAF